MNKLCIGSVSANYFDLKKVSLSTPFITKNRCKKCASFPNNYYYLSGKYLRYEPKKSNQIKYEFIKKICKRMCTDQYQLIPPKYFNTITVFSHNTNYKSFLPKLHRTRGRNFTSNLVEFLMCDCGATSWAFSEKAVMGCPEISNRKSRYKYPQDF